MKFLDLVEEDLKKKRRRKGMIKIIKYPLAS